MLLLQGFRERIDDYGYSYAACFVFVPTSIALEWMHQILGGTKLATTEASRKLKQFVDERAGKQGAGDTLLPKHTKTSRGYMFGNPGEPGQELDFRYDLPDRIEARRKGWSRPGDT